MTTEYRKGEWIYVPESSLSVVPIIRNSGKTSVIEIVGLYSDGDIVFVRNLYTKRAASTGLPDVSFGSLHICGNKFIFEDQEVRSAAARVFADTLERKH